MNGVFALYKEKGFTSFDAVAVLRGILRERKIGHAGTLDPDAEGVLVICAGSATKLIDTFVGDKKEYEARLLLGVKTDTYDVSGNVLSNKSVDVNIEEVNSAIMSFVGEIDQVPPMYSAKKIDGKKLYELARSGVEIERKPVRCNIYDIKIKEINLPHVDFKVTCSKGTYIRSLCNDIGVKLGCGGTMEELLRTSSGRFKLEDALKLKEVEERVSDNDYSFLISTDTFFDELPEYIADTKDALKSLNNGNPIKIDGIKDKCRVYDDNHKFIGVYEYKKEKGMHFPYKLFWENR